jgi:hypothetical protein
VTAPLLVGYGAAYAVATTVRDAVVDELTRIGQQMPRVYVTTGAIAWDGCDDCGQLVVGVLRDYLTDALPAEEGGAGIVSTGTQHAFDLVVQAIRCAPTLDERGYPPTTGELETSAVLVLNDANAVFCSVFNTLMLLQAEGQIIDYLLRPQVFAPPQGACIGSELAFAVTVQR